MASRCFKQLHLVQLIGLLLTPKDATRAKPSVQNGTVHAARRACYTRMVSLGCSFLSVHDVEEVLKLRAPLLP